MPRISQAGKISRSRASWKTTSTIPVALGNDANMAALGEWRYGAGQGHHDMLYLTISTGIGSGVIMRDKLLLGAHGLAGELGHVTVMMNGPLCGCGQAGHLEALASGTAMLRWLGEHSAAERHLRCSRTKS